MRIAAIACAAIIGLAANSAWAGCNWNSAKASDVVASATNTTPVPSTPVRVPPTDKQG